MAGRFACLRICRKTNQQGLLDSLAREARFWPSMTAQHLATKPAPLAELASRELVQTHIFGAGNTTALHARGSLVRVNRPLAPISRFVRSRLDGGEKNG